MLLVSELGASAGLERLESAGFVARASALALSGAGAPDDRAALTALEKETAALAARADVDARAIGVVGFGRGGTLAFLLGCTSRHVAAVADCGGPLLYPELSSARPIQPLELALNLDGALLIVTATRDPAFPPEHLELCRESLSSAGKHFDIVIIETEDGSLDDWRPESPAFEEAWQRTLAFLHETFE